MNKSFFMRVLLFVLLFAAAARVSAADSVVYHVKTYVYKKVGAQELGLDVFAPEGVGAGSGAAMGSAAGKGRPVIVLFHGGSWVSGDKSQLYWQCRYFVQQGMVAVTADYRLMGKDSGIVDAKSAVRWVRGHAGELGIDVSRLVLGGASAGGHLATMVLLNSTLNDAADDRSVLLSARALVLFNPAYSLADDPAVEPYHGADARFPPTVFFYGSNDKWKLAGDSLRRQLGRAGVACEGWVAEGQVHGFFNKAQWNEATCVKAQAFLAGLGLMGHGAVAGGADATGEPGILRRED
jgi:acetyl esterase